MAHRFVTSCIGAVGEDINEMVDLPLKKEISNRHFIEKIAPKLGIDKQILEMLDFETKKSFADDWALSCATSYYQGIPCVYVQHSRIEHIFVDSYDFERVLDAEQATARQHKLSELQEAVEDLIADRKPANDKAFYALAAEFEHANREALKEFSIPMSSFAQYRCNHSKAFALFDRKNYGSEIQDDPKNQHEDKGLNFKLSQW